MTFKRRQAVETETDGKSKKEKEMQDIETTVAEVVAACDGALSTLRTAEGRILGKSQQKPGNQ